MYLHGDGADLRRRLLARGLAPRRVSLAQRTLCYERRIAAVLWGGGGEGEGEAAAWPKRAEERGVVLVEDRRALLAEDRLIAVPLAEPPPAPLARRPSRSRPGQHERRLAVPRTPVRGPRHGQRSGQQRGAKVGLRSCSLECGLEAGEADGSTREQSLAASH